MPLDVFQRHTTSISRFRDVPSLTKDTNVNGIAVVATLHDSEFGVPRGDVPAVSGVDADVARPPHEITRLGLGGGDTGPHLELVVWEAREVDTELRIDVASIGRAVKGVRPIGAVDVRESFVASSNFDDLVGLRLIPSEAS